MPMMQKVRFVPHDCATSSGPFSRGPLSVCMLHEDSCVSELLGQGWRSGFLLRACGCEW